MFAAAAHVQLIMPLLVLLYALTTGNVMAKETGESRFDNAVVGVPVISCERDYIRVTVATARPFAGKIFVKGEYANRDCMRSYVNGVALPTESAGSGSLRSQTRVRPTFNKKQQGLENEVSGPDSTFNEHVENGGDIYGDSQESLVYPEQAARFTNGDDVVSSSRVVPATEDSKRSGDPVHPTGTKTWSGYGGASSSHPPGQQYLGAFGGSRGEETKTKTPSVLMPNLKIYRKSKPEESDELLSLKYPGPQGFTAQNCPVKCEPCTCSKEQQEASERRRRNTNTVELSVPLGACNAKRDRKLSPPTLSVSFVAVVSFHDSFITKLDRAYHIQCAYVDSNRNLSTQLDVGMPAASELNGTAAPPVCGYRISGPDGQPIQNVRVGDPVIHEWSCSTSAPNLYSMLIHSCYVEDGAGQRYQVIDEDGCSLDHYILNTPQYNPQKLSATVDAFIMKFPDRSSVDFQCAIQVCSKLDTNCTAITPPICSVPNSPIRKRRSTSNEYESMTIHANSLTVLDADITQEIPRPLAHTSEPWLPNEYCFSVAGFGILVSASTFLATIAFGIAAANIYVRTQSKW